MNSTTSWRPPLRVEVPRLDVQRVRDGHQPHQVRFGGGQLLGQGHRHPRVRRSVQHQRRHGHPGGVVEVVHCGPVDAVAQRGELLRRPDHRRRYRPAGDRHRSVRAAYSTERAQREHRRVEHDLADHVGLVGVLEERRHDRAAHRLPDQHDVVRAVRPGPGHRGVKVLPLARPVLQAAGGVRRHAQVVAVGDVQDRQARPVHRVNGPQHVTAGTVLPVHRDRHRRGGGRGGLGREEPRRVAAVDHDLGGGQAQTDRRLRQPVGAVQRRQLAHHRRGAGHDLLEGPDDRSVRAGCRRTDDAGAAVPRQAVHGIRVEVDPGIRPLRQGDRVGVDGHHLDVVEGRQRAVGRRRQRAGGDLPGEVPRGRQEDHQQHDPHCGDPPPPVVLALRRPRSRGLVGGLGWTRRRHHRHAAHLLHRCATIRLADASHPEPSGSTPSFSRQPCAVVSGRSQCRG